MQAVTKYLASDGREFESEDECRKHEAFAGIIAGVMSNIGPERNLPHGCWIQRDRQACLRAKRRLVEIARTQYDPERYPVFKNDADAIHPCSAAGRILTDSSGPLSDAWTRLMRIDFATGREYDQPYFANNPGQAEREVK